MRKPSVYENIQFVKYLYEDVLISKKQLTVASVYLIDSNILNGNLEIIMQP